VKRLLLLLAVVLLSVPPLAHGQEGTRQTVAVWFDERRPAQPTGVRLAIDYLNPQDAQAKPPAVQKVVIAHAPGSEIDTSVPERCEASNSDLMARGPAACPPASKVGVGEVDLDTGFPGPSRVLTYDVAMFNNTRELILLLESKSEPRSRIVARSVVEGGTITTDVSPVPGGPPDGFTAIKRVRLSLDALSAGGRSYVATPASCPAGGSWTNTVTFTYRDGVTQTVRDSSPCIAAGASPRDDEAPRIRLRGIPRRGCARHRVMARVRVTDNGSGLARAELLVDGRRLLATRRERFSRRIRAPRRGRRRVTVVAVDNAGNRAVRRARFRRCRR
jgi:hypothetical protein